MDIYQKSGVCDNTVFFNWISLYLIDIVVQQYRVSITDLRKRPLYLILFIMTKVKRVKLVCSTL